MGTEELNRILRQKYDCRFSDMFKYCNKEYIMGLEILENGIRYRYFENNQDVSEVTDKKLLKIFREKNENHSDIEI